MLETERATILGALNGQALPVERILRILWDIEVDAFTFSMRPSNKVASDQERGAWGGFLYL